MGVTDPNTQPEQQSQDPGLPGEPQTHVLGEEMMETRSSLHDVGGGIRGGRNILAGLGRNKHGETVG